MQVLGVMEAIRFIAQPGGQLIAQQVRRCRGHGHPETRCQSLAFRTGLDVDPLADRRGPARKPQIGLSRKRCAQIMRGEVDRNLLGARRNGLQCLQIGGNENCDGTDEGARGQDAVRSSGKFM